MKAPPFAYVRAQTLAEVFELLESHGAGAKLLAGGQSLLATLNLRLSAPELLIDITRIPGLAGIRVADGKVSIGALTTHAEIECSAEIAQWLPMLTLAAPHIAHVAIRNVGTFGGSIAMADPAAEWPACCVALGAEFVIAREFFQGLYATDIKSTEVLTAIEIPVPEPKYRSTFIELTRRRGDYAIVGVAAAARNSRGTLSNVRLAYLGAGPIPMLARSAMAALEGRRVSATVIDNAGDALAVDLDPSGDTDSTPATKMHLARVITARALVALGA
jgi:carbon-monoxide dehydrogenase medium subunit